MIRRGTILLSVLVVVSIGALVGTTMLMAIDAERGSAETALRQDRLRSLAWSGIQGVMAELASQRDDLLAGHRPELTRSWDLAADASGRRGVVRLVVLDEANDAVARAEPGKLDINHASAEMLASLDVIDDALAQRIVQKRQGRPFTSVEELLLVKGVTSDMLYGTLDPLGDVSDEPPIQSDESVSDPLAPLMDSPLEGQERLVDVLTVFSADPNVTAGWDDESHRGEMRINLNLPWSDRLGRALADRFGDETASFLKAQYNSGINFTTRAELLRFIFRVIGDLPDTTQLYEELLPVALDSVATSDDAFVPGRIDINAASARVLATIPGIDAARAEEIVRLREDLDEQRRQTPVWPLIEGVLDRDQFVEAADSLTTRSLQWRVRIEAGYLADDDALDTFSDAPADLSDAPGEARLDHRVVFDVVIDVGSTRPRVAYLRDITMLDAARTIASERGSLLAALTSESDSPPSFETDPVDNEPLDGISAESEDVTPETPGARSENPRFSPISDSRMSRRSRRPDASGGPTGGRGDLPGTSGGLDMVDRRIGRWTNKRGGR